MSPTLARSPTRAEEPGLPAASNVPGAQAPSIHSHRRITFALKALPTPPPCRWRAATGWDRARFPMTKGDGRHLERHHATERAGIPLLLVCTRRGRGSMTPPARPHFGYGKETSGVAVPEAGADSYAIQNVPHGEVRAKWYLSKTTRRLAPRAWCIRSPGYAEHSTDPLSRADTAARLGRGRDRLDAAKAGPNSYSTISIAAGQGAADDRCHGSRATRSAPGAPVADRRTERLVAEPAPRLHLVREDVGHA